MSDKPAGWYPDPDGENRQRYWDGDGWTDYYTPLATTAPQLRGAATATTDYPYLSATRTGAHHDLMVTPGTPGTPRSGWPAPGGATEHEAGETQEFTGGGGRSRASLWALVAASVLVLGLVAGVGWWAIGGGAGGDPTGGPTTSSGPPVTDGPTTTAALTVGDAVAAEVPAGGLWVGTLDLDTDTTLVVDARADGADLLVEVLPAGGGDPLARNDDRGSYLAPMGGSALNPFVAVTLPAGSYEVAVSERQGAASPFDLVADAVDETLTLGEAATAAVPADGGWFAVFEVPADGAYRIEVTSEGSTDDGDVADPVLVLVGPDSDQLVNDDRGQDQYDPLLEDELVAGTWVVVVTEFTGSGIDTSVQASAA